MERDRAGHPVSSSGMGMYTCPWGHTPLHTHLYMHRLARALALTHTHTHRRKDRMNERESCFLAYKTGIVLFSKMVRRW